MLTIRQDIRGTTPQDVLRINENFMNIGQKLTGNIDFEDTNKETQNKISTQWIPIQGEGNFDSNYPLYIRFFVPPSAKKITSSSFNMTLENYRMDSSITSTVPSRIYSDTKSSTSYPGAIESSSTSQQVIGSTTSGGGGTTSSESGNFGSTSVSTSAKTSLVNKWGWYGTNLNIEYNIPTLGVGIDNNGVYWLKGGYWTDNGSSNTLGVGVEEYTNINGGSKQKILDLLKLQHQHEIPAHSHNISFDPHKHDIIIQPHSHNITIPPHDHTINIPPHSHDISVSFQIPEHTHSLNTGIFVSQVTPNDVQVFINDTKVSDLHYSGIQCQNWSDFIKIGEWNIIKVTTTSFARAVLYGTLEVIIKN